MVSDMRGSGRLAIKPQVRFSLKYFIPIVDIVIEKDLIKANQSKDGDAKLLA